MTRGAAVLGALLLLGTAAPLSAQERSLDGPTWEMNPYVDIPIVAIELTVGFGWLLGAQLAPAHCAPMCDRNDVWKIDRFAAGWYSETWSIAGDLTVAAIFLVGPATLAVDEGFLPMLSDLVVIAEAVAGSIALSILSNMSTRRPRPHLYGTRSPLEDRESGRATYSFFSGHAAGSFAAAVGTFLTLRERHPEAIGPWIALAVGFSMATFVAVSRVAGGQHFPTDTVAGAVVGTGLGILVPHVHDSAVRVQVSADDASATLGITGPL